MSEKFALARFGHAQIDGYERPAAAVGSLRSCSARSTPARTAFAWDEYRSLVLATCRTWWKTSCMAAQLPMMFEIYRHQPDGF
ncbi:MAG: hypothetical protein R3C56_35870 [Pirellulaceae bacterium]